MSKANIVPVQEAFHSIRVASQRTGLSGHVIRIWEKRYGAVEPARTESKRRLYSDQEVARLRLLKEVTQSGHSIGTVARLSEDQLRKLLSETTVRLLPSSASEVHRTDQEWIASCMRFVKSLDQDGLTHELRDAFLEFGHQGFLVRIAAPLAQALGTAWQQGEITAAHEHFASAHLKHFLNDRSRYASPHPAAPSILIGTPSGQIHELGATIAAAAAANAGWKTLYLGTNLPAAEMASAAIQNKCCAVALSVVYPEADPQVSSELTALRRYLPPSIKIVVGGRAARSYSDVLTEIQAHQVEDLTEFCAWLEAKSR